MKKFINNGMSLLEVLVVVTIFAVLGILVTESVILTLQGAKKSESVIRARENLDYSLSIIERQIRNANSVSPCTGLPVTIINYLDQNGNPSSFACMNTGSNGSYIASGSAHLTGDAVAIINPCSFTCVPGTESNPSYIKIELTVKDASSSGIQSANVSASTQIYLRNY